ncbi:MAG TPA: YCF48-related protein, partial [Pyrinomonadaceae bacterium]|nr:YCF48-related protein [Pyrinomonadaceae bacterium]
MGRHWAVLNRRSSFCLLLAVAIFTSAGRAQKTREGWTGEQRGLAGKDLNAVHFTDSKRGWIAGDEGYISHTGDGGQTWSKQNIGLKEPINDIFFRNEDDGYVLSGNGIFTTEDGGATWREARRFAAADFDGGQPELYSVRFVNKKRGWVVGSASRRNQVVDSLILSTEDGGLSWQRLLAPTRQELIHVDFTSDERGWVVGAGGTILHTRDGGKSWTAQRSGTQATLYHVDFRDKNKGWAVGERGTLLRTTDGGTIWETVKLQIRSTLLSVEFINGDEGWAVGRGGIILRSNDGGA